MNTATKTKGRRAAAQAAAILAIALAVALGVNGLRSDSLALVGDWSPEARLQASDEQFLRIPLAEAQRLQASGKGLFLDARTPEEFIRGHIAGAKNLPWHGVEDHFFAATDEITADTPIVTYCDGDACDLSGNLARFLLENGFTDVRVLVNGWALWQANKLPISME
jgi:rhodanese-related sulfurtransferase